jgi:hypothetical protein
MDISRQDNSNQAEIARLKTIVEQQGKLLASLLPRTEEMPSDLADFDREAERAGRVEQVGQLFRERTELLKRIDETVYALGDLFRAEKANRRHITPLLHGVRKDLREQILVDTLTTGTLQARLGLWGILPRRNMDATEEPPRMVELADIHSRIISQIQKG